MMKKRVRILGVFGVISLLSYTAMVVFSLTALVLVAIGAGKEPIPSLQGWTLLCLAAMIAGPLGTAPPFYYYNGFSKAETAEILSGVGKPQTYQTALAEYAAAHDMKQLAGLLDKENMLNIPMILVTHNSDIAEKEIREFGGASETQAKKIEALWQEVMQVYLTCTTDGTLIRAENSSHYIHLGLV